MLQLIRWKCLFGGSKTFDVALTQLWLRICPPVDHFISTRKWVWSVSNKLYGRFVNLSNIHLKCWCSALSIVPVEASMICMPRRILMQQLCILHAVRNNHTFCMWQSMFLTVSCHKHCTEMVLSSLSPFFSSYPIPQSDFDLFSFYFYYSRNGNNMLYW